MFPDLRASPSPAGTTPAVDPCELNCAGKTQGDNTTDPTNCNQYYICLDAETPSDIPFTCPSDAPFFSEADGFCGTDLANCAEPCTPSSSCKLICEASGEFVADAEDCGKFYVCLDEGFVSEPLECPVEKPFFDPNGPGCVDDESVCCEDPCALLQCTEAFTQIPDLTNCTKFYFCLSAGSSDDPAVAVHATCSDGENFDHTTSSCSPDATCVAPCAGVPPGGGSGGSTSSTPSGPICLESMMCTEIGFFPACETCRKEYFHCVAVGQEGKVEWCTGSLVFSLDPNYPYCVTLAQCQGN